MLPIYKNSRILLCLLSTIYIFVYLIFEHFTTGVQGHYPFHDDSLPFISNWWGIIVVPLVTFCLTTLLTKHYGELYPRQVWIHLAGGGLYAAINAVLFFSGNVELLSALVLPSVVILALFFPIYRPDYVLGYYIVSTVGFGSVIPLIGSVVFAVIGFIIYKFIRPAPVYLYKIIKK